MLAEMVLSPAVLIFVSWCCPAPDRVRIVGGLRVGALQSDGGLAGGKASPVVRNVPRGGGVAAAGIPGGQV